MKPNQVRSLSVRLVRESEKAILVSNMKGSEVWLPKSQLHDLNMGDGMAVFNIDEWLFDEKGMDDFLNCVVSTSLEFY